MRPFRSDHWILDALPRLGVTILIGCQLASPALAACPRPITVFFPARLAAVYAAQPANQLPSLADAIAQASACTLRILDYPPARAMDALNNGRGDMMIGAAYNADLEAIDDFVPMLSSRWLLLARTGAGALPEKLGDFAANRKLLVGMVRGVPYPADVLAALEPLRRQQQIDEAVDIEMALDKLMAGRDAAVLISATAYIVQLDRIAQAGLRPIPQLQLAPAVTGIYLGRKSLSATERSTLISAINAVVAQDLPVKLLRTRMGGETSTLLQSIDPH